MAMTAATEKFHDYRLGTVVPFVLLHVGALAAFFLPFRWQWFWLAVGLYVLRMFGITAGYHRYFSHRTYRLNRFWQFCVAFLAETSGQKGVLWWAAHHRVHHRHADHEKDIHPPSLRGFWWAHVGWVLSNEFDDYDPRLIGDYGKFSELRWLDKHYVVPPTILAAAILLIGGPGALVWGFLVSTVVLFHATFTINSVAHLWGTRRFATPDDSRNNFLLAVVTMGEGWHNNHHQFMYACRQGIRWWEFDPTYYALRILSWLGIARDLRDIRLSDLPEVRAA
ncbi:MAG TPA: fatty acid desaturase [Terriglobales bacterium]|jgi:stearoyl-CoA desaturase (delta-9 desaturase)|nr:fatty acid desaturase [Terriglobales bacterium]